MSKIKGVIEVEISDPKRGSNSVVFKIELNHGPDNIAEICNAVSDEMLKSANIVRKGDLLALKSKDDAIEILSRDIRALEKKLEVNIPVEVEQPTQVKKSPKAKPTEFPNKTKKSSR